MSSSAWAGGGDRMRIDRVDISKYGKQGIIRYYIDILDGDNRVIPDQDKSKLKFYVNDDPISPDIISKLELQSFRDVGEPVAVGILFTNYGGFIPKSAGEPSLFHFAKAGLIQLVKELNNRKDYVAVWLYNEAANDNIKPFTTNLEGVIGTLEDLDEERIDSLDDEEAADSGDIQTPRFYKYLNEVVGKMKDAADEKLPQRRILIVVSDGVGQYSVARKSRIDKKLKPIIESARDAGIKIYSFGAMLQENAFLPYMNSLAEETLGLYREIKEPEALEGAIADLAPQIQKQYVVDLTAPGLPSDEKVKLRVDAETPNSEKVSSVYPKSVKLAETPTDIMAIVWIVLYVIGGLLGLFLLYKTIKGIIGWRRNRPQDEEYEEYEEEYSGPDRGKLRVRSGPLAGEVFHLIEDISTIGCIDGNHIVLQDEGVSKRHAGIKIEEMRYELADFGSTNGTWVNGRKINKQFLRDGDEIRIGNTELEFTLK